MITSIFVFQLVITLFSLASPWTALLAHGLSDQPSNLSFVSCGTELEPQDMPEGLYPYHSKSLKMTDAAFADPSLVCTRAVLYGPMEHQLLDVWAPSNRDQSTSLEDGEDAAIVVFIHGGGWDYGYREYVGFCAKTLCNDSNSIMVAPSYAIGKGKTKAWPQSRDDIVEVLRWITNEQNDLIRSSGGNPRKIVLAGHSAGGHLAACVGLDAELLSSAGIDPSVIKALFLISCPLGIREEDFFGKLAKRRWLWKTVGGPIARFIYKRGVLKALRPVVGSYRASGIDEVVATKESIRRDAEDASPLGWLPKRLALREKDDSSPKSSPLVHISYASEKDFFICGPHANSLINILGKETVDVLEIPVVGHLESHFALADPTCEWHDAFRKTLSSL